MKLLKAVRYRPIQRSIMTSGHANSGVTEEQVDPIFQCLFDSLAAKRYFGKSHLVLYNSENPDEILERLVKIAVEYEEPALDNDVFARCNYLNSTTFFKFVRFAAP